MPDPQASRRIGADYPGRRQRGSERPHALGKTVPWPATGRHRRRPSLGLFRSSAITRDLEDYARRLPGERGAPAPGWSPSRAS